MNKLFLAIIVLTLTVSCGIVMAQNIKVSYDTYQDNDSQTKDYERKMKKAEAKLKKAEAKMEKEAAKMKKDLIQVSISTDQGIDELANQIKKHVVNIDLSDNIRDIANIADIDISDIKISNCEDGGNYTKTDTITRNYKVGNFTAIRSEGIGKIIFKQQEKTSLKVIGDKVLVDRLTFKIEKGTLVINLKDDNKNKVHYKNRALYLNIYISAPKLTNVALSGCTWFSSDKINGDSFTLNTSGASSVVCPNLRCNKLSCSVSGASKARINFEGETAQIDNSGVSSYNLNVNCKVLDIDNSGLGKMKVTGTAEKTDINSSGLSHVDVSGLNKF